MRLIFTLFTFCFLQLISAQKKFEVSFQLEGRTREAIISVPTKLPPNDGWPIVMMLHGTSGDKDVFYNAKGWKELGQEENFITIFPSSLKWCFYEDGIRKNNTRFVCGGLLDSLCPEDFPNLIDDIAFFKKLVEIVDDTVNINKDKVFISGFSNGSSMTHNCSMKSTDLFSAAGGSSSPLHELDSLTPTKRIPIWYVVGTLDDRYFSQKYPDELPFSDTILLYHGKPLKRALVCQGLTEKYSKIEYPNSITYTWIECRAGEVCAPYRFTINKDQTHQYPNGSNHPFNAPVLFWEFFNNPPSTTMSTSIEEQNDLPTLKIFPNPAKDFVTISDYVLQYDLFEINGRLIMSGRDNKIDITDIKSGLYIIRSGREFQKLSILR